jgi:hypothetical protein
MSDGCKIASPRINLDKRKKREYMQQLVFQSLHWRYGAVSKFLLATVKWFDIDSVKQQEKSEKLEVLFFPFP